MDELFARVKRWVGGQVSGWVRSGGGSEPSPTQRQLEAAGVIPEGNLGDKFAESVGDAAAVATDLTLRGALEVAEGAVVAKGASVVLGGMAGSVGAAARAGKAVNLPAWRKVGVDIGHILERHVPGAKYSAGRSVFPSTMNEKRIRRAIREAYESSTKVGVQGEDRVLLQGHGRGLTIEMWFNKATNRIETAYPVTP